MSLPPQDWDVSPSSVYFPNVPTGQTRDAQFTITNNNSPGFHKSGGGTVSISGDHPQYFSCISGCNYYLDPGEDHTVTIRFTAPCNADNMGATIEFPINSGGVILAYIGASVTGSGC